jgi:glycosyltransferase involved in cell wall biosynthesis
MVAVGRLSFEKGYDLLLEAFAACAGRHPEWSLEIAGEGPLRVELEAQAVAAGLGDRVRFLGLVNDVEDLFSRSDLFVLSSRFEGFPNALLEAMSVGLACIAFDCASGPSSIIRDGIDGVLVPAENAEELSLQLDRLMSNGDERGRLGREALGITGRLGLSGIMTQWERLTDEE